MGSKADKLVNAYYNYSKDIGENMERFDIIDRVERLEKNDKDLFQREIEDMKKKGYYRLLN